VLLLVLALVYILFSPHEGKDRSPAPTPVNENVHDIAP
jgi:hypothetical protein